MYYKIWRLIRFPSSFDIGPENLLYPRHLWNYYKLSSLNLKSYKIVNFSSFPISDGRAPDILLKQSSL